MIDGKLDNVEYIGQFSINIYTVCDDKSQTILSGDRFLIDLNMNIVLICNYKIN